MALQIASDLHLESPKAYDIFEIQPKAPILALIGDIGNVAPHRDELAAFFERQLRQFQAVLFVAGNHEAYHSTWPETWRILQSLQNDVHAKAADGDSQTERLGKLVLLNRDSYRMPDNKTLVLGCSLFSYVPPDRAEGVSMGLNDFYETGGDDKDSFWDIDDHNRAHARDLAWLNQAVSAADSDDSVRSVVVLTHWCPTLDRRARDPKHLGSDRLTSAFASDLSGEACFRSAKVKTWAFGHTHFNCDFAVDRQGAPPLRLVTNQRGNYFSQAAGYDDGKVII